MDGPVAFELEVFQRLVVQSMTSTSSAQWDNTKKEACKALTDHSPVFLDFIAQMPWLANLANRIMYASMMLSVMLDKLVESQMSVPADKLLEDARMSTMFLQAVLDPDV